MLLGLIRPTSGSARLFGRDPLADGARALDGVAGFVEGPRFYSYLSGRRNLELLADYDGDGARARIDGVLEIVELRDRAKDRVGGYSHGMRQRLGIAASLLRQPSSSCSTSRPRGSIRPACATCAISSAVSQARASRFCSRATSSTKSRTCATASRSSERAESCTTDR